MRDERALLVQRKAALEVSSSDPAVTFSPLFKSERSNDNVFSQRLSLTSKRTETVFIHRRFATLQRGSCFQWKRLRSDLDQVELPTQNPPVADGSRRPGSLEQFDLCPAIRNSPLKGTPTENSPVQVLRDRNRCTHMRISGGVRLCMSNDTKRSEPIRTDRQ